jgi:hypothetical protein
MALDQVCLRVLGNRDLRHVTFYSTLEVPAGAEPPTPPEAQLVEAVTVRLDVVVVPAGA